MRARGCVRACVCVCVCACVRACVRVCVCGGGGGGEGGDDGDLGEISLQCTALCIVSSLFHPQVGPAQPGTGRMWMDSCSLTT